MNMRICRDRIERFIDDNKALTKRMYGEFIMSPGPAPSGPVPTSYVGVGTGSVGGNVLRRSARDTHDIYEDEVPSFFGDSHQFSYMRDGNGTHKRTRRQTVNTRNGGPAQKPKSNKCVKNFNSFYNYYSKKNCVFFALV